MVALNGGSIKIYRRYGSTNLGNSTLIFSDGITLHISDDVTNHKLFLDRGGIGR